MRIIPKKADFIIISLAALFFIVGMVWTVGAVYEGYQDALQAPEERGSIGEDGEGVESVSTTFYGLPDTPPGIHYTEDEFYNRPTNKNGEIEQETVIPNVVINIPSVIPKSNMLNQVISPGQEEEIVQHYYYETLIHEFTYSPSRRHSTKTCVKESEDGCEEWVVVVDEPSSLWLLMIGLIMLVFKRIKGN